MPSKMDKSIGARIRQCRENAGLSPQQFAAKIGVTVPVLNAFEDGGQRVNAATLMAIAHAVPIKMSELFVDREHSERRELSGFAEPSTGYATPAEISRLVKAFDGIGDVESRDRLVELAEMLGGGRPH